MQYGICCTPEMANTASQAGFDYFEGSVGGVLKPLEDEAAFQSSLAALQSAGLPCPAVNVFVPASLKITGPEANLAALQSYAQTAFRRAKAAGVKVVVFGSGGARRIPDGFDRAQAWQQLVAFCRMLGPLAAGQMVTVVVEPLNREECNVLNSVGECARLVREVNHPAVRLLVDAFHLLKDGDSLEDLAANGDLLAHVHVATLPHRLAPGMEDCALEPFFAALKRSGYDGRVSIEGALPETQAGLSQSLQFMRGLGGTIDQ